MQRSAQGNLKERMAAAMEEAAEVGQIIRKARRNFANYKTTMTFLGCLDGAVTESRWAMENYMYDFQNIERAFHHLYLCMFFKSWTMKAASKTIPSRNENLNFQYD
uniref:BAR_3_WASP_bdg domain-containing protein n=1 Tax=Haemonchus contortus TaxID=6289 RepID=A0A7I5ECX5_HAECO